MSVSRCGLDHDANSTSGIMDTIPIEIVNLIVRYHNAFGQGPVAASHVVRRCLQFSCLQARVIGFCVDTSSDDEDGFWILPGRHALVCCASFTCAPRLRHPQPERPRILGFSFGLPLGTSAMPEAEYGVEDYLGGASSKPCARLAVSIERSHGNTAALRPTLPIEMLRFLPTFFFDVGYLRALAMTSRQMLDATRKKENWHGLQVNLDQPDLQSTQRLRSIVDLLGMTSNVCVNLLQLAMFITIPANAKLRWEAAALPLQPATGSFSFGYVSTRPLMGFADFEVYLPEHVRGLYVGIREVRGERRSFCCRIDNVFQPTIMWSLRVNQLPAMPHQSASRYAPIPNSVNKFQLKWNQRSFAIGLNGQHVSRCRLREEHEGGAAPPLAEVFFMAFGCGGHMPLPLFRPLPSPIQLDSRIKCGICQREHALMIALWSVCPMCNTWVCSSHVGQMPGRRCPNCILQLRDYLGGSSAFEASCWGCKFFLDMICL